MKLKKVAILLTASALTFSSLTTNVYATESEVTTEAAEPEAGSTEESDEGVEIDESEYVEDQTEDTGETGETPAPDSEVQKEEPSGQIDNQPVDNGEDPDFKEEENPQGINSKEKTISAAETFWDIDPLSTVDQVKQFNIYVDTTTNKYQVFYSADTDAPEVLFQSASGSIYMAGTDYDDDTNNFHVKTVKRTVCTGFPDLVYDTIYISGAPDPGNWIMQVTIHPSSSNAIRDLVITQNVPDQNWATLNTEYKTHAIDLITWYFYTKGNENENSAYELSSLPAIFQEEPSPATNDVQTVEIPEEKPKKIDFITIGLVALIIIIIAAAVLVAKKAKNKNEKDLAEKRKINNKTNKKLKEKKKKENEEIDDVLNEFGDDYIDDDDILDLDDDVELDLDSDDDNSENVDDIDNGYLDDDDDIEGYEETIKKNKTNKNNKPQKMSYAEQLRQQNNETESIVEPTIVEPTIQQPDQQSQPMNVHYNVQYNQYVGNPGNTQPIPPVQPIPQMQQNGQPFVPPMSNGFINPQIPHQKPLWITDGSDKKKPDWVKDNGENKKSFF